MATLFHVTGGYTYIDAHGVAPSAPIAGRDGSTAYAIGACFERV